MGPEFYAQTANFLHSQTQILTMLKKWRADFEIAHLAMYVMTLVSIQEDNRNWALMLNMMGKFFKILEFPNYSLPPLAGVCLRGAIVNVSGKSRGRQGVRTGQRHSYRLL